MRIRLIVLFGLFSICLAARANTQINIRGTPPVINDVDYENLAKKNSAILNSFLEDELHHRSRPGGIPELGISLSGGGPRSAAFCIGVLAALHKTGLLQRADYLSSVSGGGYASVWFYAQQFYALEHSREKKITLDLNDYREELFCFDPNSGRPRKDEHSHNLPRICDGLPQLYLKRRITLLSTNFAESSIAFTERIITHGPQAIIARLLRLDPNDELQDSYKL